jgi:hypothetical protein
VPPARSPRASPRCAADRPQPGSCQPACAGAAADQRNTLVRILVRGRWAGQGEAPWRRASRAMSTRLLASSLARMWELAAAADHGRADLPQIRAPGHWTAGRDQQQPQLADHGGQLMPHGQRGLVGQREQHLNAGSGRGALGQRLQALTAQQAGGLHPARIGRTWPHLKVWPAPPHGPPTPADGSRATWQLTYALAMARGETGRRTPRAGTPPGQRPYCPSGIQLP